MQSELPFWHVLAILSAFGFLLILSFGAGFALGRAVTQGGCRAEDNTAMKDAIAPETTEQTTGGPRRRAVVDDDCATECWRNKTTGKVHKSPKCAGTLHLHVKEGVISQSM